MKSALNTRLMKVTDAGDVKTGFVDDVKSAEDYTYDWNGNMTSDNNKGITVEYNHLNLPSRVIKSTGESMSYIYDADGRKLSQVVLNASSVQSKATDYEGEFIYENDTLRFVNHEEGRLVINKKDPEYQYHLKDHLGNVRMTFTTKREVEEDVATLETETAPFLYYDEAVKIKSAIFDHTNGDSTGYSTRLSGKPEERYGLAKSISVMAGDTINAEVFAKYLDPDTAWTAPLNAFITSIVNNTAPAGTIKDGGLLGSSGGVFFPFWALFSEAPENDNLAPKAYLNWLVFDRDYNLLDGGARQITGAAAEHGEDGDHERLSKQILVKEAGYVYVYLSNDNVEINEGVVEVYWDDFKVEHVKSPVIESSDYYPFGLTFNLYSKENSLNNQYRYNGNELQDELGLSIYDFGFRNFDPNIGRMLQVDPLTQQMAMHSPYCYGFNNPIRFIDVLGLALVSLARQMRKNGILPGGLKTF